MHFRAVPMIATPLLVLCLAALGFAAGTAKGSGAVQKNPPAKKGEEIYVQACAACHATGVAGAPKVGDKAAWAPHIKHGFDHMVDIVIHGKGAMPPRGGQAGLSDDDIRAAVKYMLEKSR